MRSLVVSLVIVLTPAAALAAQAYDSAGVHKLAVTLPPGPCKTSQRPTAAAQCRPPHPGRNHHHHH